MFAKAAMALAIFLMSSLPMCAKTVVFEQAGFPTISTAPVELRSLLKTLGNDAVAADLDAIVESDVLQGADLLVLPYGSAVPAEGWPSIHHYLECGGNLLIIGGQPLHVPVVRKGNGFVALLPQDTYSRVLDLRHTYEVPDFGSAKFAWREGYAFLPPIAVHARRYFAVEGKLNGLGYMVGENGTRLSAPVIVADMPGDTARETRLVALDLDAQPGYWDSADGQALIRTAANYAQQGAAQFWVEARYSAIRPGEVPQLTVHLERARAQKTLPTEADVVIRSGARTLAKLQLPLGEDTASVAIPFSQALPAGFYTVAVTYMEDGKPREYYANGFDVEDISALETGPALGTAKDFLTLGGKPFLPVGTNYFSTEAKGWDFSGARNALVWEKDFAEMERHNVTLVRTGVWMPFGTLVESATGNAKERFLRNVEAYLAAAHRHNIAVNFTFFAFTPRPDEVKRSATEISEEALPNPYLDPSMIAAEQHYVLSVVERFKHVPWLCYDLINEPSFSNPHQIFHGNVPNGDPVEENVWHLWLEKKYETVQVLAQAWRETPEQLGSFDNVPLPSEADLNYFRSGNRNEVRALDYNLFAQEMFAGWVRGMVSAIRATGSRQLINVGQDEGGVTDRLLNRFYATAGVAFTTNHTYWQDQALLWDSIAAKSPGTPNITGETGYQPAWQPDGSWRYDELTGTGLEERKWALGFAAGSSGAMQWDWDREVDFGIERSDGSAKVWESMIEELGTFAKAAAPFATKMTLPQTAIVLSQSLQMSVYNKEALEAQQTAVRALYNYDHATAFAVGEYQIDTLGSPKLIILPSAYGLSEEAWQAVLDRVKAGAVLLISGPFAADAHLHATDRAEAIGLPYRKVPLELRDQSFSWSQAPLQLQYGALKTETLDRAELTDGRDWEERTLGKGRILFSALPLELNDRLDQIAPVYTYARKLAGVSEPYTSTIGDPGILICPTIFPSATLYVLTSETNRKRIEFSDVRSGKNFAGSLEQGRAALLLIGTDGKILAKYGWHGR